MDQYFHLALTDTNRGRETACGTTSENLASRWSLPLVSCPECLVSQRFRELKGLRMPRWRYRIGEQGDQS